MRLSPAARSTRLTVAGETPACFAMCLPPALAAQRDDLGDALGAGRAMQPVLARRAVDQAGGAFRLEPRQPLARRSRADACGSCGGLRRLPALHRRDQMLSTKWRRRHSYECSSGPPGIAKASATSASSVPPVDNLLRAHIQRAIERIINPRNIRIAISGEAFDAIARTLPFGSVGYKNELNERGERLIWLDWLVLNRLRAMRGPGESYSDVILRIVADTAPVWR